MFAIALVGRPNAGKSTLFNRFTKSFDAITSEVAGTTRDIRSRTAVFRDKTALVLDTGGLESRDETFTIVRRKAIEAAKSADLTLFIADSQIAPDDAEKRLFYELQKTAKKIALVLNKIDNKTMEEREYDFMSFGAQTLFMISCAHKRNLDELERWIADQIVEEDDKIDDGEAIRVAIIGRPNVGKSALLNALVGYERSVVSSLAGTTIDPVDEKTEIDGRKIVFIDTAGVRKRGKIEGIERFAFDRTEKMLESADVALIVLDSSEEFCELDEKIAGLADRFKTAAILVLNKIDITRESYAELEKEVRNRFIFLSYAPIISLSATTKKRAHKLGEMIIKAYENYSRRVPTAQLNEIVENAVRKHNLPSDRGKAVRIYYSTQYAVKPPTIALVSNRPRSIHFSYLRYLANQLRENADFEGAPIVIHAKSKQKEGEERA